MVSSHGDWSFSPITTDDNKSYLFSLVAKDINDVTLYTGSVLQTMLPGNNTVVINAEPYTPPVFSGYSSGGSWAAKTVMTTARSRAASAVVNGKVYVIGGESTSGTALTTVEEYDPTTNLWTTKAPMPTGRRYHAAAVWHNSIYVFGGESATGVPISTVEAYDTVNNTWITAPVSGGSFTARARLTAVAFNDSIYTIGGTDAGGGTSLSTVEIYNPVTCIWTTGPSLNIPRSRMSAIIAHDAATGNPVISVTGGEESVSTPVATQETLALAALSPPSWVTGSNNLPAPRSRHGATVAGIASYVVGGITTGSVLTNVVWRYDMEDPAATFQAVTPLPTVRNYPVVQAVNGKVYVIGGTDNTNPLATVEEYTPADYSHGAP